MGHWNYRVIRHDGPRCAWLGLHEVYYNDDGTIDMWCPKAEMAVDLDEGVEGLLDTAKLMQADSVRAPILDAKDLPGWKPGQHTYRSEALELLAEMFAAHEQGAILTRDWWERTALLLAKPVPPWAAQAPDA